VAATSSTTTSTGATSSTTTTTASGKGSSTKGEVEPGIAGAPAPATGLSGPITVGLDFKPDTDGFGFENYGKSDRLNLIPDDVARFFGDQVCASKADGKCTLTPPAQQWMESTNDGMNGGHCEGMAVLALLIKKGQAKASDFGGDLTSALKPDGNDKLTREIAYWFATQFLDPTAGAEIKNLKPSEVVTKLRESFQPGATESYTLGIYKTINGQKKEGHAITPFGLVDLPDGKVEIALYDNNFPGATRALVVDTTSDKWTYSTATNPAEPVGLYEGDATTGSLTITPPSARFNQQACPFCGGTAGAGDSKGSAKGSAGDTTSAASYGELYLNDAGDDAGVDLRVTNPDGSPLAGLKLIEVKGADLAQDDSPPTILVPTGQPFKVTIDGTNVAAAATTSITFIDEGADYYIDDIMIAPGQIDEALFDPAKGSISYATKRSEAPTIGTGFSSTGADYGFAIGGVDLPDGGIVTSALDQANGTFTVKNEDENTGTYALSMVRIDDSGEQTFTDNGFDLPSKASVAIDFKDWSSKNDKLKVKVDRGDGSAPTEAELQSS
jgi:hypothetical protein